MEPQRLRSKILTWYDSERDPLEKVPEDQRYAQETVPVVCFLRLGRTSLLCLFLLIMVTSLSYRDRLISFLLSDFPTAFSLPLSVTRPIFLTASS